MKIWRTMDAPDEIDVKTVDLLRNMVNNARTARRIDWLLLDSFLLVGVRIGIWIRTGVML